MSRGSPDGFSYETVGQQVVVSHHGRQAAVLRGWEALRFLADVQAGDARELMARLTGDYRRGDEREARQHPRDRGR